ncbi:MAG: CHASE3 domain-containing protein, partial [Actinomycetes bacterium]
MGGHAFRMPIVAAARRFAAVAALVVGLLAVLNLGGLLLDERAFDPQVRHAVALAAAVGDVHEAMLDQETGLRGWQMTGEGSFLTPYREGGQRYRQALGRAYALADGNGGVLRALARLSDAAGRWSDDYAVAELSRGNAHPDAASLLEGKRLFDTYRAQEQALRATVSARATAALDSRTAFSAVLTVIKLALTVVLLGIAGWRWRRVRSELAEPVDEILAGLTLYQRGDLTAHIDVDGNSEMTAIARQAEALAAAVLAHREAIDEQRRTAQASDRLHQRALVLSRELTGLLDRDDILTVLLPAVAELAAAERVSLIAVDGDRPSHVVATTTGGDSVWDAASADVLPPHVSASGLGRAARLLQPVSYRTHEGEAALALPLGAAGRLHGVLEVVTVTPLGPGHVDALASLAL